MREAQRLERVVVLALDDDVVGLVPAALDLALMYSEGSPILSASRRMTERGGSLDCESAFKLACAITMRS